MVERAFVRIITELVDGKKGGKCLLITQKKANEKILSTTRKLRESTSWLTFKYSYA